MKKTFLFKQYLPIVAFALLSLMVGCNKDNDGVVSLNVTVDQYAGSGKLFIDEELYACWSNNDAVRINGDTRNIVINGSQCRLENVPQSETGYVALYPDDFATDATVMTSSSITNLLIPATQTYAVDAAGRQLVPAAMAAYQSSSTGTELSFHNACVALKIALSNNYSRNLLISSVSVSASEAPLSGSFNITGISNGTPVLEYANAVVSDDDRIVTLQIDDGLSLASGDDVSLYLMLPPTAAYSSNKFTVHVTAYDEVEALTNTAVTVYEFDHTQAASASGVIARNKMVPVNISLNEPHTLVLKGIGTEQNPYKIYSVDDLLSMSYLVNQGYAPIGNGRPFASAYYKLMGTLFFNNGDEMSAIGTTTNNFTGHFDGNGNAIRDINVLEGIFGYACNATISNLVVVNANVDMVGQEVSGVVCAHADHCVIDACRITGTVSFTNPPASSAAYIGGIVGEAMARTTDDCIIKNCHCGATISLASGTVAHRLGGIAGHLLNSQVLNSYTKINNSATSSPAFSVGNAYAGGIVGRSDGGSSIVNCYFGIHDHFNGVAGHTADLCGEISSSTRITHSFFADRIVAIGSPTPEYLQSIFSFEVVSGTRQYTLNGTHASSLLNAYTQDLDLHSWQLSTNAATAPELSF